MKPATHSHPSEDQYLVTHHVDSGDDGSRLDAFLKHRYRRRSREQLKKAIEAGAITIERRQSPHLTVGRLKPSLQLMAGDRVLVLSDRKPEPEVSFDYRMIFEDDVLFVIDKPANLPVHPAGKYFFNTLLVHLKTHAFQTPLRAEREFFLAHRIDKETSGILVLTKDKEVCAHLTRQFAERRTRKRYLAVVHGMPPEAFTVDAAMKRANRSLVDLKMMVAPESDGGQPALTQFKRLTTHGGFSLVECLPRTGRQHQIRLHLESAGHPIVGDKLYGRPDEEAAAYFDRRYISPEAEARLILPRHALHAAGITFEHPVSGEAMSFSSDLPGDLQEFLKRQPT